MRLRIRLENARGTTVPINHQEYLTAAIYRLLETSDADFARFLHDEGYAVDDGPKRFKLFTFSSLRAQRRRIEGDRLHLPPGPIEWWIASPVDAFLRHLATGLLAVGVVQVGPADFPITQIETHSPPILAETTRFSCLTPLVATVPLPDGGTRYLRPTDGSAFSDAIRRNLALKFQTLHGHPPLDDRFALTFDPAYLARDPHDGTKMITFKGIHHIGAFAPLTVSGSVELMQLGYEAGFGEKNATGFGMVEVASAHADHQTRGTG